MGPFLDARSEDLAEGDMSYIEPGSSDQTFLDYNDMMNLLMKLIREELSR